MMEYLGPPYLPAAQLLLVMAPLFVFVREDIRKYRVRETTLYWLVGASVAAGLLPVLAGGDLLDPFLGAGCYLGITLLIREIAYRVTGTEAFGPADVILAGSAGMVLGLGSLLTYLFLGSCLGILLYGWIQVRRRRKGRRPFRRLPAGPGFAAAQLILMILTMFGARLALPPIF